MAGRAESLLKGVKAAVELAITAYEQDNADKMHTQVQRAHQLMGPLIREVVGSDMAANVRDQVEDALADAMHYIVAASGLAPEAGGDIKTRQALQTAKTLLGRITLQQA